MYDKYIKYIPKKGVFTQTDIPANIPICEFKGSVYTDYQLLNQPNKNDFLQIGPNTYLSPSGNVDDHIRHSCNPNCVIKPAGCRAILYSLHFIKADSEITFDYSTTSTDTLDSWSMKCNCGSYNCRKIISGFHLLNPELQKDYNNKKITALFIRNPIFNRKD